MLHHITKIQKRSGDIETFDQEKIQKAVFKALTAAGEAGQKEAQEVTLEVVRILNLRFEVGQVPQVEQVQDIVEEILMVKDFIKTARAFILYRDQRRRIRELGEVYDEAVEIYDQYISEMDWQVKENANMAYSLQGLNNYGVSSLSKRYWLNKIYPKPIRDALESGDFHIHDLDVLGAYCCGWDLYDLLIRGFGGVKGKVECAPAQHLRSALGQAVNFLYTLQGESAGAQAMSSFDTLLAPFIRYDNLSYDQVKKSMQSFMFNCAVPTRVGFQTPFSNITLDLNPSPSLAKLPVIIGGKPQKETYADFQTEMDILNQAFYEVIMEGDKNGRIFTFPIPTVNITKDFDWKRPALEALWQATAKYGVNYFANFIQSDMNPEEVRSMCCRLRLSNKELLKKGGGLFGANPQTGSIGVVTVNMPRIGYLSKTRGEFFQRLGAVMDLAKDSLEIKRKAVEDFMEKGLYPYSKYYLANVKTMRGVYYGNHFSTIGLLGLNECLLNFMGETIASTNGRKFALEVLDFMKERIIGYQEQTDNLYNLESTPAEGASFRLALKDKKKYENIITAGTKEVPYYTNSSQLPVNYTDDVFEALDLQDDLQCAYTGGCIEKGSQVLTNKGLLKIEDVVENFKTLKPIKALSYNPKKGVSEWDNVVDAVAIDVKKHNKIRIKGEKNLDITTSDWHPFFVLEKFKPSLACPICGQKISNLKQFANHIRWNKNCGQKYKIFPKYKVVEKRADQLAKGDYILQNSDNLYPDKKTNLSDDLMWLIGFFIGDGCISKYFDNRGGNNLERHKLRFSSEQGNALKNVSRILKKEFVCEVKPIHNDKRSPSLQEVSTSKSDVCKFFFDYGFKQGKKVYDICLPLQVKRNISQNNVYSLLAGLMDSDGHLGRRDGNFEYYTCSEKLANDILEICSVAGIMISKREKKSKRKNEVSIFRLAIPAYEITKLKDKLCNNVHLSRIKPSFSNKKRRRLPVVRVKEVSKVNVADNKFFDLTTANNHNYLAGNGSLVFIHNTVAHIFLGERISDIETVKHLVKTIFTNYKLPYITLTPTFSICPVHGYLSGEHWKCPQCMVDQDCEVYSRVVGYLRPVQQWHKGKTQEFKERKVFSIKGNYLK